MYDEFNRPPDPRWMRHFDGLGKLLRLTPWMLFWYLIFGLIGWLIWH